MEIGDNVFSKNGTEFNCTIVDIKGSKVTLEYEDNYTETCTIDSSSIFKGSDGYEMANWTVHFEQL
jgi:hypothetical protein